MKKIFLSIVVSIIISFLGTNILFKNIKPKWELIINYEHISRSLNVDYEIIMGFTELQYERNFTRYIDTLNSNISTPGRLNHCSKIRSSSSVPNVLLKYDKGSIEIVIQHKDKKLIELCEKFIDSQLKVFTSKKKELLKKIVKGKQFSISNRNSDSHNKNQKIINLLKQNVINAEKKDSLSYQDIQSLTTSMMLLDFMSPKNPNIVLMEEIDRLELVTKSYRNIYQERVNKKVLYISLFIISFSTILIILNFRKFRSKKTTFKKIFNSIIN